jgi:hypothetical protein
MNAIDFIAKLSSGLMKVDTPMVGVGNASHGWFPLPGGQLELGDTGYFILTSVKASEAPFQLVDPDGRIVAHGYLLQPLKQYAEQCAADRKEFDL